MTEQVISFEHINAHGIHPHENVVELTNTTSSLINMETGVYSRVEAQWDTTSATFTKSIKEKIKKEDRYAKVELASNMDEIYKTSWKPGGTMVGGQVNASRVEKSGSDHLGRWSWVDLRGKRTR